MTNSLLLQHVLALVGFVLACIAMAQPNARASILHWAVLIVALAVALHSLRLIAGT